MAQCNRSSEAKLQSAEALTMIRLEGGLEPDAYWMKVLETGDDRLTESGFADWVVTL